MSRVRQLTLLLLVALWLPATLHCNFEAIGLDELFHCGTDHHSSNATASDSCGVVENGWIKRTSAVASLAAPSLTVCFFAFAPLLSLHLPIATDRLISEFAAAPPEFARTWQFTVRAAPPARAPSALA